MMRLTTTCLVLLGLSYFIPPAFAADATTQAVTEAVPKTQKTAPAAAPKPAPVNPAMTLSAAYKKEFAFLEAQKHELQKRLHSFKSHSRRDIASLEQTINQLEHETVSLSTEIEQTERQIIEAERAQDAQAERSEVLEMTYAQAETTLKEYGLSLTEVAEGLPPNKAERLTQLYGNAAQLLKKISQVRNEPGQFFLQDGKQANGTIIRVGNIAAYGVSAESSGVLAPAGSGRLKLWKAPAADTAQALQQGQQPELLKIFLFESSEKAIEEKAEKTVLGVINDGGLIAWIIVSLGLMALVLILLRILFLYTSSKSASKLTEQVVTLIGRGNVNEAYAKCQREKGSIARVMEATVRNLERDRDHLEDIISEAILHESGHLNRFGTVILVIASVAPLLGLLGTVTGMIATFDIITEFGTGDPKLLSGGISIALITTEVGLAIAIPTLLIGTLLSGWAERIKDDMEKAALKVSNVYTSHQPPTPKQSHGKTPSPDVFPAPAVPAA